MSGSGLGLGLEIGLELGLGLRLGLQGGCAAPHLRSIHCLTAVGSTQREPSRHEAREVLEALLEAKPQPLGQRAVLRKVLREAGELR